MASLSFESALVRRFHLVKAPTLEARLPGTSPIVFSRMRSERAQRGRSISPLPEEAFTFQVPLISAAFSDFRYANKVVALPERQEPGRAFLFDLSARPTVGLETEFDNVRCYISQKTIDDLAYDRGLRRVGGLRQRMFGQQDRIMFHLAQMLVPALDNPDKVSAAFIDYIALAFHEHVISVYGGVPASRSRYTAPLSPRQIRDVIDYIETNLTNNPSIGDLARECNLSSSYFTKAFRQTMHMAPHQWLLRRRIENAKAMLRDTDIAIVEVAILCGFCDQSHLSRVFTRIQGCSPREWRRLQRCR
ncbi:MULTISPECIES: AraC family transcriptional regulator [Paraburkholderia]|uniref:AraC family transcriptional regulator n=1 Tax=Paraburkholderia TaxID=1822464 RepID=UPI002251EE76|nr:MULTISPECIES: AraC family transcriptional regulator [Paraburkholderia]MCX4174576.1 AraC family transcriptional regulator [Paraburkholderia madseniana]MDQ6462577.1 AraC family transcriptional regulator [Paraburkholderia madseniana]